jgi:preprotein translocase subunit YajC
MFITHIHAEELTDIAEQVSPLNNTIGALVPLVIFVLVFYFIIVKPQKKKQEEHEKEVKSLKPNDLVVTMGGIYAKVKSVKENVVTIEIAENVFVDVVPDSVTLVKQTKENKKG